MVDIYVYLKLGFVLISFASGILSSVFAGKLLMALRSREDRLAKIERNIQGLREHLIETGIVPPSGFN